MDFFDYWMLIINFSFIIFYRPLFHRKPNRIGKWMGLSQLGFINRMTLKEENEVLFEKSLFIIYKIQFIY